MINLVTIFYYNFLPLLNVFLFIAFIVCLVILLIKLIGHKKGKATLLIILGAIFLFANVFSFGLMILISKERVYDSESRYLKAKGDKYLAERVPGDATEVFYSQKYPVTLFGWIVDGVSYKIDSKDVSEQIEDIFKENYFEGYKPTDNQFYGMSYEQWNNSASNEYNVRINKKLLGGDNIDDYQVVYIEFANGIDTQVFVNEKTGRFVYLLVNHD